MSIDHSQTYWNHKGRFKATYDELEKLIPEEGECGPGNPALDRLRQAVNIYYDLFNNGLINLAEEFEPVFGFQQKAFDFDEDTPVDIDGMDSYHLDELSRWYGKVEKKMDIFIQRAAEEQGITISEATL